MKRRTNGAMPETESETANRKGEEEYGRACADWSYLWRSHSLTVLSRSDTFHTYDPGGWVNGLCLSFKLTILKLGMGE